MISRRRLLASVSATALVALAGVSVRNAQSAQSMSIHAGTGNGEWRSYAGDLASTRYAPLDQINRDNFTKLEVAWRFKTNSFGPRPETNFEGTPLMVGGSALLDRRLAPLDRGARCRDRRTALDASRRRRPARRSRTAPTVGPRSRLLERRRG